MARRNAWEGVALARQYMLIHEKKVFTQRHRSAMPWKFLDKSGLEPATLAIRCQRFKPGLIHGFEGMACQCLCLETFLPCINLYCRAKATPSSHAFRWASDLAKFYQDWGPDLCKSRRRAHGSIGVSFECPYQHLPWYPVCFDWIACARNSPMSDLLL